mgnify:CR=1 FL=1
MTSVTITKARENIYGLVAQVNEDNAPVTIVNTRGEDAVLIAASDWAAIEETLYLHQVPGLAESIKKGAATPLENCIDIDEVDW